ncbi:uncharacterized protein EV422DRAFT_507329 [Fimicolochytrium jonesii]|uniref:uncharacterized protein n=1 Tax=Fimicolochytrium jonesii TaxID=1396493 RepID=UPI0022FE8C5B|nr:uncharacterized protein EV422DRAFT_507329 [Fimicolochytrium jonesii]KAI8819701.1 hypothetical protein EV422DRAFT_507329 [Fimicolochytrium jonesii]
MSCRTPLWPKANTETPSKSKMTLGTYSREGCAGERGSITKEDGADEGNDDDHDVEEIEELHWDDGWSLPPAKKQTLNWPLDQLYTEAVEGDEGLRAPLSGSGGDKLATEFRLTFFGERDREAVLHDAFWLHKTYSQLVLRMILEGPKWATSSKGTATGATEEATTEATPLQGDAAMGMPVVRRPGDTVRYRVFEHYLFFSGKGS